MEIEKTARVPPRQAGTIYRQFFSQLRRLTGATAVSLYIESSNNDDESPLLLHSSARERTAEFESVDAAERTVHHLCTRSGPEPLPSIQAYPGTARDSCLIQIRVDHEPLPEAEPLPAGGDRRRRAPAQTDTSGSGSLWIGLRFAEGNVPQPVLELDPPAAGCPRNERDWLAFSLLSSANLVWQANRLQLLLRDPISRLPGRAEFQFRLKSSMDECRDGAGFGLLLVNPDEFEMVNRRLDRDSGDAALAQVATMLSGSVRSTDNVYRYGGAVFAVLMPGVDQDALVTAAEKVRQSLTGAYLNGAMRLSFSIGAALYVPAQTADEAVDDLALLRRADQALNAAKNQGGDCSVLWLPGAIDPDLIGKDQLAGIFTANVEKDYRNMLILWDVIAMVSHSGDERQLAKGFVERIQLAMRPAWAALFTLLEGDRTRLLAQSGRATFPEGRHPAEVNPLLARASETARIERLEREPGPYDRDRDARRGYAVPLKADERVLACLYLEGPESELQLDSSDQVFLNALAGQVALALDRIELAARWHQEQEQESRRLRSEVQGLRHAVQSARLVYSSRQMDGLLATARAAAPTDVTVLIRGESGTGKEMLARSVHEMSSRKGKPFVTVDCGSIAANLIEAELFGAVKGAFTGAERAYTGRIVQADSGTLFLDEIGEVPLDVQAKLLRFVQEKEIHPVGAATSQRVDVRIIAATNRDLAREVAAGRFREDLYFRLNVVTLIAPPLRERPDDILPLAGHFLERFALQYNKGARRFSPEAERMLLAYRWPGNVRELQNSILRTVVLSTDEVIGRDQLLLEESSSKLALTDSETSVESGLPSWTPPSTAAPPDAPPPGDPWREFGMQLDEQVDAALKAPARDTAPLGRWLSEDLVLAVDRKVGGTARRAARRLGVAETTYRRQLEKAQRLRAQGQGNRSQAWGRLQVYIDYLADSLTGESETNVVEAVRNRLLESVASRVHGDDKRGSALMGITVPTYRRWLQQR
jgi:diguanylate cyclase (GGDEF)-like protein